MRDEYYNHKRGFVRKSGWLWEGFVSEYGETRYFVFLDDAFDWVAGDSVFYTTAFGVGMSFFVFLAFALLVVGLIITGGSK